MTISTSRTCSSPLIDDDTAARIALAAADVAGDIAVAIGIRTFGGVSPFVAAIHNQRDAAAPLARPVRERIRSRATAANVMRIMESTSRLGLGILTPQRAGWPSRLDAMHGAAPLLLWTRGDESALDTPSVAISGSSAPGAAEKQMVIELATGLSSRGWTLAAGPDAGVDGLVLRSAKAMESRSVLISPAGLEEDASPVGFGVQVSEMPPLRVATAESRRRAQQITVALAGKLIVDDVTATSSRLVMVRAAAVMHRPVGLLPTTLEDSRAVSTSDTGQIGDASLITSIHDADTFH